MLFRSNILNGGVNGASFNEDGTLAAPGSNIVSANADYANTGNIDVDMSGTSMAAPHVAGAAALVQQALETLRHAWTVLQREKVTAAHGICKMMFCRAGIS